MMMMVHSILSRAREQLRKKSFLNDDNHALILFSFCSFGLTPFFFFVAVSLFLSSQFPPFSIQSIELT